MVFQMADKAPRPNGFPPSFFQQFWPIIGESLVNFIQYTFQICCVPREANETLICLIPKVNFLKSLSQLRPISLCNVIIKIISKVLANRLQPLMSKLTRPN